MTDTLVIALFVEGRTDERFLPVLVQRTAEAVLLRDGIGTVDVLEPILVKPQGSYCSNAERMVQLAIQTAGYHMLIIHNDADYPSAERALTERFQPGWDLIQQARHAGEAMCEYIIPIIPIQMIEAWMLADAPTLHAIIGTRLAIDDLGLPSSPHQVESLQDPKGLLLQAVERALLDRPRRRRHPQREIATLQEALARQIRLDELRRVPAFREFETAVSVVLRSLRLIHE